MKSNKSHSIDHNKEIISVSFQKYTIVFIFLLFCFWTQAQSLGIRSEQVDFESKGTKLVGTILIPDNPHAAIVLVHGSGQEKRMLSFGNKLAQAGIAVFTYDKRGVGESEGIYAGPEVGTNNIDSLNLDLLASDADMAAQTLAQFLGTTKLPIGLLGFSQAGWIIPIAASKNENIDFMVVFSGSLVSTLAQLRFQFFTDGRADFWSNHTEEEVQEHIRTAPDRYVFVETDPMVSLRNLSTPGLWIFGGNDIQVPVVLSIEQLEILRKAGRPFQYYLYPSLGHNTGGNKESLQRALDWIKNTNSKNP